MVEQDTIDDVKERLDQWFINGVVHSIHKAGVLYVKGSEGEDTIGTARQLADMADDVHHVEHDEGRGVYFHFETNTEPNSLEDGEDCLVASDAPVCDRDEAYGCKIPNDAPHEIETHGGGWTVFFNAEDDISTMEDWDATKESYRRNDFGRGVHVSHIEARGV